MSDFVHGHSGEVLPEIKPSLFVLQPWVGQIPLRQQGVLLLALRGPDGIRKESIAKIILRNLRGCVMLSGREEKPMAMGTEYDGDTFMRTIEITSKDKWERITKEFFSNIDEYNVHFLQHLLHAAQVIGVNHWNNTVATNWWNFYAEGVHRLHLKCETADEMKFRLRSGRRLQEDE
jgi:hypothetical protein